MKITKELIKRVIFEEINKMNLDEDKFGGKLPKLDPYPEDPQGLPKLELPPETAPEEEEEGKPGEGGEFMTAVEWRGETMDTLRSLGLSKEPRLVSMLTRPQVYGFFKSLNDLHAKVENNPAQIGRLYDFLLSMSGADLGSENFNKALSTMRSQRALTKKYASTDEE